MTAASKPVREVLVSHLGKCEHCKVFVVLGDSRDDPPRCHACGGKLSFSSSFGLGIKRNGEGRIKKSHFSRVAWIGSNGLWTQVPPEKDFILGSLRVRVNAGSSRT